jgi:hypothetical protein
MKEIYLAMDSNKVVFGFDNEPFLRDGYWARSRGNVYNREELLSYFGIDITIIQFVTSHETPIKIRAVWEVIND